MARMKWKERALLAVALAAAVAPALACTRAVYLGDNGDVITARSMDWKVDVATNLYVLPRGIATFEAFENAMTRHRAHWPGRAEVAGLDGALRLGGGHRL